MSTLYSSVIKLTNQHNVSLTHVGGQHAHAAFFHIIEQVDPVLSKKLHDIEGNGARKPFTISPLIGLPHIKPSTGDNLPEIRLREGWQCWLRVTMLDDVLFHTFLEYFLNESKFHPSLRIGDAHFVVSEILNHSHSHDWAGNISLDVLQNKLSLPAPQKFAFELHSPTAFGWKDGHVSPMPSPAFVFGNLARAWDAITGQSQSRVIERYAAENLAFGNFELHTDRMILHNKPHLGALGRFEFVRVGNEDDPLARALNLLADLAFYTGLGRKTTQGMGMARRV